MQLEDKYFTMCDGFCNTSTESAMGKYVSPHLLNLLPHPSPLYSSGFVPRPGLGALLQASNLHWSKPMHICFSAISSSLPPSPSHEHKGLFLLSVSPLPPCWRINQCHLLKFHTGALIYGICLSLCRSLPVFVGEVVYLSISSIRVG